MTGSKEIPLVARTGKLNAYSSETDSEHEKKSEGEPLIDPTVPIRKLSSKEKLKVYLTGVNWKNIAASVCLWLAVLTCCTAFSLMGLFFPQQALDKGASQAVVGVIIGLASFSVAVLSPLLGYLLPLAGLTAYTLLGLLMVGGSYILLAFVTKIPSTWGFILVCMVLRAAEGVGSAMFFTATFSTFPKLFPNHVSLMVGLFEVAAGLGFSVGRPIGGFLFYVGGYMAPFLAVGLSAIVISIPCVLLVRKMEIERPKHFLSWTVIVRSTTNLYFLTLVFALVTGFIALSSQGPVLQPFLIEKFHVSEVEVTFVFFVFSLAYALISIPAGVIINRLESVYISVVGLLIAAFGEFLLGMQEHISEWHLWLVYVSVVVIGTGSALAVVPIYANLIHVAERYLGKEDSRAAMVSFVSGVVSSAMFFGQFGGPVLSGTFMSFFSYTTVSILMGEIVLAEVLLLLGISIIDKFTYAQNRNHKTG